MQAGLYRFSQAVAYAGTGATPAGPVWPRSRLLVPREKHSVIHHHVEQNEKAGSNGGDGLRAAHYGVTSRAYGNT